MSELHIKSVPLLDTKPEVLGHFPDYDLLTTYIKLPQNK